MMHDWWIVVVFMTLEDLVVGDPMRTPAHKNQYSGKDFAVTGASFQLHTLAYVFFVSYCKVYYLLDVKVKITRSSPLAIYDILQTPGKIREHGLRMCLRQKQGMCKIFQLELAIPTQNQRDGGLPSTQICRRQEILTQMLSLGLGHPSRRAKLTGASRESNSVRVCQRFQVSYFFFLYVMCWCWLQFIVLFFLFLEVLVCSCRIFGSAW